MDVDTMEAGRETDFEVHRTVFPNRITWGSTCPRYSSKIEAAWQVVEALHGDGWHVQIALDPRFDGEKRVQFAKPNHRNGGTVRATGDDVPLLICRAALKAVADD